jgi:hypothetical protein
MGWGGGREKLGNRFAIVWEMSFWIYRSEQGGKRQGVGDLGRSCEKEVLLLRKKLLMINKFYF